MSNPSTPIRLTQEYLHLPQDLFLQKRWQKLLHRALAFALHTLVRIFPRIMEQAQSQLDNSQVISIDRSTRWQVRQRLQELDIFCECLTDGRLRVLANTPVSLIQLRSVLQQWSTSPQKLSAQLERCWQISG